ncbi:30S ribosomal subunit protein S17 [Candidatus Promineifilum breve]|jgi:small subunit ribosomal protein S17|uniref:Small ribosomal subunit protein uS17 n=1 Tax=Candidatus Promineifilum breve TaxID=1806508 RepID=A0A160T5U0_9CHLR|nr:30S ribosomal protein S17 [Candidatus Promineifilum breve]CUS05324.2 30S ribosomal subunit protein S17 [Candidatus Promineifilum breve]
MREQRKRLVGVVTSDKMDKTIVVAVATTKRHPIYGKIVSRVKKYKAHDENNESRTGDRVLIIESSPYSREKRFALVSVLERAD